MFTVYSLLFDRVIVHGEYRSFQDAAAQCDERNERKFADYPRFRIARGRFVDALDDNSEEAERLLVAWLRGETPGETAA